MTQEFAIWIIRETFVTALLLAAPMLLAGLVTGLTISLLQSVTQIHEMTLTFIPKILAVITVLILMLPWMSNLIIAFANNVYGYFAQVAR